MMHKDISEYKTYKAHQKASSINQFLLTKCTDENIISLAYAFAEAQRNGEPTEAIQTEIDKAYNEMMMRTRNFLDGTITHQSAVKIVENEKEHTQGFDPSDRY